ncbi:imelysin family protein [Iodobacter sp. LRB]|uniref:imelysin family protein n=1 Tax=unclassified Iodobacter TaxID=235634 RepID=UPI000C0F0F2D|nr:imelysin family protein [Iodobacter sp. BJB302]PHV01042.1 iron-regulated protein [Iodobacter sp. BJB302]
MKRLNQILCGALAAGLFSMPVTSQAADITNSAVLEHYSSVVYASYSDSIAAAREMQTVIDAFLTAPSEESLAAARKAWLAAREFYLPTEAYRFYSGPIDDAQGPEARINAWPIDESYIDYVKGKAKAGIINNPKVAITKEKLKSLNEKGGEENVSTGWHAIEFLLWGQDFNAKGPGDRQFTDFVDGKAPNADRRRQYMKVVTGLMIEDLENVAKQWAPAEQNYRSKFIAGDKESLKKALTGLGVLTRGELAGQRMEVAMDTQNQEDEHSCFSDNTHRDVVGDIIGMQNVWEGRYTGKDGKTLEGASLKALVAQKNPAVADLVSADIAQSLKLANEIQAPFDQEIIGKKDAPGRKRVQAVIDALKKQGKDLVAAAETLGIKRLTTKQP